MLSSQSKEYEEFLKTPEWKSKAKEIMKRAKGVCERCCENKASDVHHLTYDHGWLPPNQYLQAVCRRCHKYIHRKSFYNPAANSLADVYEMVLRFEESIKYLC